MCELLECLQNPNAETFARLVDSKGLKELAAFADEIFCDGHYEHSLNQLLNQWVCETTVGQAQEAVVTIGYARLENPNRGVWEKCGDRFMREYLLSCVKNNTKDLLRILQHDNPQYFKKIVQWPEIWEHFFQKTNHMYYSSFAENLVQPSNTIFLNIFLDCIESKWMGLVWKTATCDPHSNGFNTLLAHPRTEAMIKNNEFWTNLVREHNVSLNMAQLPLVWDEASETDKTTLMGALVWKQMSAGFFIGTTFNDIKDSLLPYQWSITHAFASAAYCCAYELRNFPVYNNVYKLLIQDLWVTHLKQFSSTEFSEFLQVRDLNVWSEIGLSNHPELTAMMLHTTLADVNPSHPHSNRKL